MAEKTPFIGLLERIYSLVKREPNYKNADGISFLLMKEMDPTLRTSEQEYWDQWAAELADFWLDESRASDLFRSIQNFQPGGDAYETFGQEYDDAVNKAEVM